MIFNKQRWRPLKGQPLTEMDKRIMALEKRGKMVPTRKLIKTPEQIEGIRRSGVVNTAVLDAVAEGLDATVVHPTGILGPEDYSLGETSKPVIQIIKGEMPAGIAGSFNLCDVRDLADGVISASEKGRTGECYILGNEEVSFKRFARIVSDVAGCKRMRMFIPLHLQ